MSSSDTHSLLTQFRLQFSQYRSSHDSSVLLHSWTIDRSNPLNAVQQIEAFNIAIDELPHPSKEVAFSFYGCWEIFDRVVDTAAICPLTDTSHIQTALNGIIEHVRPRELYLMAAERLAGSAGVIFSILSFVMESALSRLPIGFYSTGLRIVTSALGNAVEVAPKAQSGSTNPKETVLIQDHYYFTASQVVYHCPGFAMIGDVLLLIRRLLLKSADSQADDKLEKEDVLVHHVLQVCELLSHNPDSTIRNSTFSAALETIAVSDVPLLYIFWHMRRMRHFLFSCSLKSLAKSKTNTDSYESIWGRIGSTHDNIGLGDDVECMVPWSEVTDEAISHVISVYCNFDDEDGDGEDLDEEAGAHLKTTLRLSRSSRVLKWSLGGITTLILEAVRRSSNATEYNSTHGFHLLSPDVLWKMTGPYMFPALLNKTSASKEGLTFFNALVHRARAPSPPPGFHSSLLAFHWRDACAAAYVNRRLTPGPCGHTRREVRVRGAIVATVHDTIGLCQLAINGMVATGDQKIHTLSCESLRVIATTFLDDRGGCLLIRKLIDSCPYPQVRGILVDVARALAAPLLSTRDIAGWVGGGQISSVRAPVLPCNASGPADESALEKYHHLLDDHIAIRISDSTFPLSVAGAIVDLFVLPPVQSVIECDTVNEVVELVEWLSSAVSLLRFVVMRLLSIATVCGVSCTSIATLGDHDSVFADIKDLLDRLKTKIDWATTTLHEWDISSDSSNPNVKTILKFQMLLMNLSSLITE